MVKNKLMLFAIVALIVFSFHVVSASSISDRTLGKESAPVTIEMFADFECPFCERWHTETFPLIQENYINEGKVKLIIRHLPLESIHFNAKSYAIASQCAADQGKFFEYIDLLYNKDNKDSLDKDITSYAQELDLSLEDFEYCINDLSTLEVVNKDVQRATNKGVENSTPSFLINGKKLLGAQPYSEFESAINLALLDTSSTLCTDVNRDRVNDEADIERLTDYAFGGIEIPEGTNADLNEDGVVNILDVTFLTNYIIRNGPTPSCAIVEPTFVMNSCGDTNGDVTLDQADLDAITSYAFEGVEIPSNVNADLNNDGVINVIDVTLMINYVNRGGEKPTCGEVSNLDAYVNIGMVKIDGIIVEQEPVIINAGDTIEISVYFTSLVYDTDVKVETQIKNHIETWSESNVFDIEQSQNYKKTLSLKVPSIFEQGVEEELTIEIEGKTGKETWKTKVQISENLKNSCGDTNGDVTLDQADLDAITSYAFGNVEVPSNVNADLNNDGVVDILDVVTMTNYVKRNGDMPSCAEKPAVEPNEDKEDAVVDSPIVSPTIGNGGGGYRRVTITQNNVIIDDTQDIAFEDQVTDTSLEDIEQRLDNLEEKVDESNKTLEKILKILKIFFKF